MSSSSSWRQHIPEGLKLRYWRGRNRVREFFHFLSICWTYRVLDKKYIHELDYWQGRWLAEGKRLANDHYEQRFLAMAGESDQSFLSGKVVADFGCGPRGSLCWATRAKERIGIDALAGAYRHFGTAAHNMRYVISSETEIPLPTGYADVLLTLNAMDHVHNLDIMAGEVLRILSAGGTFIGSFNLDEPPAPCEPQVLTEELIHRHLLYPLRILSYRIVPKGPPEETYRYFSNPPPDVQGPRILWVRAEKGQ